MKEEKKEQQKNIDEVDFIISGKLINIIANYLAQKPWAEVNGILNQLAALNGVK